MTGGILHINLDNVISIVVIAPNIDHWGYVYPVVANEKPSPVHHQNPQQYLMCVLDFVVYVCSISPFCLYCVSTRCGLYNDATWSETYFREDLFPAYLFFRLQFHATVIFRFKLISDLGSGSLPRFFGEFIYTKLKIVVSWQDWTWNGQKYAHQWIGLGFELGLG